MKRIILSIAAVSLFVALVFIRPIPSIVFLQSIFQAPIFGFFEVLLKLLLPITLGFIIAILVKEQRFKIGIFLGVLAAVLLFLIDIEIWRFIVNDPIAFLVSKFFKDVLFEKVITAALFFVLYCGAFILVKWLQGFDFILIKKMIIGFCALFVSINIIGGIIMIQYVISMNNVSYDKNGWAIQQIFIDFSRNTTKEKAMEILGKFKLKNLNPIWYRSFYPGRTNKILVEIPDLGQDPLRRSFFEMKDLIKKEEGVTSVFVRDKKSILAKFKY